MKRARCSCGRGKNIEQRTIAASRRSRLMLQWWSRKKIVNCFEWLFNYFSLVIYCFICHFSQTCARKGHFFLFDGKTFRFLTLIWQEISLIDPLYRDTSCAPTVFPYNGRNENYNQLSHIFKPTPERMMRKMWKCGKCISLN